MHRQLHIHSIYRLYLVAVAFFLFYSGVSAQTVIGGDTVDISAVLDIQDTTKGVLLPRLTTVQRNAIMKPANGLVIFNVTENGIQINQGTPQSPNWVNLAPLPGTGNQNGNMLYWNGTSRVIPSAASQNKIFYTINPYTCTGPQICRA